MEKEGMMVVDIKKYRYSFAGIAVYGTRELEN